MESYGLLEQHEEDALHMSRLLNVEEKPFKRITKRLLAPGSLVSTPPTLLPTPPPDASNADELAAEQEAARQKQLEERRQFREDVILDFAAFESSIARIQFLLTSNEKERERYAKEKQRISETAQAVKDSNAQLRVQLEEAQKTLALRKTWDELTEKITNNRMLRPREDQHANLEKLNAEIADLERESKEYAYTWAERREQFGRIIHEGMELRRLIRDEKEEVERREGMEEREDGEDGDGSRLEGSNVGTPRPDAGGSTPLHHSHDGESGSSLTPGHLSVLRERTPAGGTPRSRGRSPAPSPARSAEKPVVEENDDLDMAEQGEIADDDQRDDQKEEGEEDENESNGKGEQDQMDTT
ncbi:MAG: hypothetical protein M1833_003017 [Piccolia ochrophora]|nr:MAG: hypothetical protein M1833_003017 [Piccolia ochrophora]